MASVATKEVAALCSDLAISQFPVSDHPNEQPHKTSIRTPKRLAKRPRTRSLALNPSRSPKSTPQNLSSREKRVKSRRSGDKSPVIDLTKDVDMEVLDAHGESPLRNASKPRKDLPTHISNGRVNGASSQDLNQIPNPQLQHKPSGNTQELNLSPIKKNSPPKINVSPKKLPQNLAIVPIFSSSPLKRRKTVAFSDTIVSDVPSSPLYGDLELQTTPRRSILKPVSENMDSSPLDPNNSTMWVKRSHTILHQFSTGSHAPNNPEFWQPGTIIQLEPKSMDLLQLVDGCVEVLRVKGFRYKFEVYATLNQIFKLNDAAILFELFASDGSNSSWVSMVERNSGYKRKTATPHIGDLCEFVKRDIEEMEKSLFPGNETKLSPSRGDPFKARVLSQALKFVSSVLAIPSINTCIPSITVKWFYGHTCDMIVVPTISKSLVLPYLSIIKDCHFSAKKRRHIFESNPSPLLERMLFALLNIRSFVSSSLVNEKFISLKNLIQKFPAIMAKNFHHWFTSLVLNLCDITFPLYTKIVSMGITALLEAARNYLDNMDICLAARKLLEYPLPSEQKSFASEQLISIGTMPLTIMIDYVGESLKELVDNGHYKFAMDIWVGLTLLLGQFEHGIENWKHLQSWLQIHKYCFNGASVYAKITALSSWKAIIYKVCVWELKESRIQMRHPDNSKSDNALSTPNGKLQAALEEQLRPKIKLLIHVFVNISSVEFQREIVDTLNHLFLSILYILMNSQPKVNSKLLLIYWDKIIMPVLINFFFKKESSNSDMHHLGLGVVNKLLKPATPVNEKSFSSIRCLSHEPVSLSEINSLNPRWVFLRFEKVLPIILTIFKLKELDSEAKIGVFNNFLNTLKFTTKKELQLSDTTYDIIDSLPMTLQIFFDNSNSSYDLVFKLIVNINDTFGASNLVSDNEETPGVFEVILSNSMKSLIPQQLGAILSMLHGAIGERKSLIFLAQLAKLNGEAQREDLAQFIGDCLNNKKSSKFSHQDMIYLGKIFKLLDLNFAGIAKKLIQHIVLLKAGEFEEMVSQLRLRDWNIQIFKFFVTLMHDAPFEHLKVTSLNLIQLKLEDDVNFQEIFVLFMENKFDHEIFSLHPEIVRGLANLKDDKLLKLWREYLQSFEGDSGELDQLLARSVDLEIDLTVAISSNWQAYPLFCGAYSKKFGKHPHSQDSESSHAEASRRRSLDEHRVELDEMLNSELQNHHSEPEEPVASVEAGSEDTIIAPEPMTLENEAKEVKAVEAVETPGKSLTLRRSERLNRPRASSESPKVVEISSDDISRDMIESELTSSVTSDQIAGKSAERLNSEEIEPALSLESEKIEDTLVDESNKKRKRSARAPAAKRQKSEASKEISDSDESIRNITSQTGEELIEIDSGSSNSKKSDNDSLESNSLDCVNSQEVSRIANTSNLSEIEPASKALSTVIEAQTESEDVSKNAGGFAVQSLPSVKLCDMKSILQTFDEGELASLSCEQRYELETAMMEFILRMRSHKK